jgi:hypothetical protein
MLVNITSSLRLAININAERIASEKKVTRARLAVKGSLIIIGSHIISAYNTIINISYLNIQYLYYILYLLLLPKLFLSYIIFDIL